MNRIFNYKQLTVGYMLGFERFGLAILFKKFPYAIQLDFNIGPVYVWLGFNW